MKEEVAKREIESLDYYLQNHTDDYSEESHTAMMMAIDALSSKWIPVSERLPQYTADYTVTVGINNGDGMYYEVRTALYQTRFNQWIVYESEKTLVGEVIAWQDSAEPYKP